MSVRDRIQKLEQLLQRIQRHSRAKGAAAALLEPIRADGARISHVIPTSTRAETTTDEAFEAEASTATIEVVEEIPVEALTEEDIMEMSSDVLESVPPPSIEPVEAPTSKAASALDETASEPPAEEEEPPASSKRHRISGTIDAAMDAAAREEVVIDDGREVPIKTPPPESGPQEAPLPMGALAAPPAPDIDQLLEDLPPVTSHGEPTPEQLGNTIAFSEPSGPSLELDEVGAMQPVTPSIPEELEVTLPLGTYGRKLEELRPHSDADWDVEAETRESQRALVPPAAAEQAVIIGADTHESVDRPDRFAVGEIGQTEPLHVVSRAPISGVSPVQFARKPVVTPRTFLEILDESLGLGD